MKKSFKEALRLENLAAKHIFKNCGFKNNEKFDPELSERRRSARKKSKLPKGDL